MKWGDWCDESDEEQEQQLNKHDGFVVQNKNNKKRNKKGKRCQLWVHIVAYFSFFYLLSNTYISPFQGTPEMSEKNEK